MSLTIQVWISLDQVETNVAFGCDPCRFASYNPFSHNVYRDAAIISLMDTFTSLLAGFTIFAILGNLSYELGKDISEVTGAGASLAFVSYPQAISKFNIAPQVSTLSELASVGLSHDIESYVD